MNKRHRHEIKMLKYARRLKKYGLKHESGKYYSFRSHGTPCSCWACRGQKYQRQAAARAHNIALALQEVEEIRAGKREATTFSDFIKTL